MPYYFDFFPKVQYDIKNNGTLFPYNKSQINYETVTNIMRRFIVKNEIDPNASVFYEYNVQDGELPWHVAYKAYDDATLDWIIFLTNDIIDPYFQWPLGYYDFKNFIISKYGTVESAQTTIHHYERILSPRVVENTSFNNVIEAISERKVTIDQTTYNQLEDSDRRIVYQYDYEHALNEKRRKIKILDPDYVPSILDEAQTILSNE